MYLAGCFTKGDNTDALELWLGFKVADVDCSTGIVVWYYMFIFFCPFTWIASWVISCYAKHRTVYCFYSLETWRKRYEIWTNYDRKVNWSILGFDIFNLVWALTGSILNNVLETDNDNHGAIGDCMKNYGMNYALMAYVFIMLGYFQIVRLFLYLVFMMYH